MQIMKTTFKKTAVCLGAFLLVSVAGVRADYITLPVKWSQPIGFTDPQTIYGVDRLSDHTVGAVMANDWLCDDGSPIVAVRWWGSYIGQSAVDPTPFVNAFDISIHASVGTHPFSLPSDSALELYTSVTAQQEFVGYDEVGDAVYRYDAYLPSPYPQQMGVEYFLDIDLPTGQNWGWHDAALPYPNLDWAAMAPTHQGPWSTFQPNTELAFEIMTIPEPTTCVLLGLAGLALLRWRRS